MKIEKQWSAYVDWYELLWHWAALLVDDHVARRMARYTLAQTFLEATCGNPTIDGPYIASVDTLYGMLAVERMPYGHTFNSAVFDKLPHPSSSQLYRFAELYAMVYASVYTARLTTHQRQHLVMSIRRYDPEPMTDYQLGEAYAVLDGSANPLRCVVEAARNHDCGQELICIVSLELWREEHLKGLRWLGVGRSDEGGERCPTSAS